MTTATLVHRPIDEQRGRIGMLSFIATEAMLFAFLFFSYFYLATHAAEWPPHEDPSIRLALIMTAILVSSSIVLHWAEHELKHDRPAAFRAGLMITILLGITFIVIQVVEYRKHLEKLKPQSDAYGSIFYTITSFHGAHVIVGLIVLGYILALALNGHIRGAKRSWVMNASLYWHFVDVIWLLVLTILYLSPRWYR